MVQKGYRTFLLCSTLLFSMNLHAACAKAEPIDSSRFCHSFELVAKCHCEASGIPAKMCSNIQLVFQRMISTFGSIDRACHFQKDTTYEECVNDWSCYLNGGKTSKGVLCSGTGAACV